MTTHTTVQCYACNADIPDDDTAVRARVGGQTSYLCAACWNKVQRGGRTPKLTIEAILVYNNDPTVGGPDDPLDHEDYRDLELLGLWPSP